MVERVTATDEAIGLIRKLQGKHGPVMFHQSGGCCAGSSPMCYPEGDLLIGSQDVLLGEIGGAKFYMNKNQYDYWKHTQVIIDVVDGRGGMFSLEGVEGKRFLSRSRAFTKDETEALGI
ncbi:DUF779 domain-containing protein [Bhargavaea beijingensis]|uniref:DUF779 domain-containing protein n=1 Tax=Bhargavaea beijingensis TaxID=426756 RepID=A0A1G7FHC9_9BACL|nr:DUF779 domain-containing protein [Bhargavaea beijingensis]MCW1929366.1 DUF779 domain-containing protein [Bhargavaea beijingensis]RSK30997.1 DUF779 domain-containing protein [Bhargavaea beijingensis]SDE75237.1 hypothetical protein SAMN04488126_1192 [Bhargavaea beijingensis]